MTKSVAHRAEHETLETTHNMYSRILLRNCRSLPVIFLRQRRYGVFLSSLAVLLPLLSPVAAVGAPYASFGGVHPVYTIALTVDYNLLTFRSAMFLHVPAGPADPLRDVILFIDANAPGIGMNDAQHGNIAVDAVTCNGQPLPFTLRGTRLAVAMPAPADHPFDLKVDFHGIVPRGPATAGGIEDLLGGLGDLGDLGGLLGGLLGEQPGTAKPAAKPAATDYGLYTYASDMLSLGAFWYPQLAVRRNGAWEEELPGGIGDLSYSDMSDFKVAINAPSTVILAAPGTRTSVTRTGADSTSTYEAKNVRDFAILMSDAYQVQARTVSVGGKPVVVESYTIPKDTAKGAQALDIAAHALDDFARRFGPYLYDRYAVVEGPIRGGAGGMEYSGLTAISSAIYGDLVKQIGDLAEGLGAGNLGQLMDQDDADGPPQRQGNARPKPGAGAPAQRPGAEPALPENPATDLLRSMLGDQAKMLDSIFEVSISHEVSHEWWAIGVGSDSQKSPFCDESLANFSAMLYYEDRYGPETAAKMIDTNLRMPYSMSRMLGCADAPANLPTSGYKNQLQYGAVIYGKAAMYHDAMRRLIGDDAFFAALRAYYGAYVGRIAGPRSLLELEKTEAPSKAIQAEALYEHWIEQTHGDEDLGGGGAGLADLISPLLGMLGGALGE